MWKSTTPFWPSPGVTQLTVSVEKKVALSNTRYEIQCNTVLFCFRNAGLTIVQVDPNALPTPALFVSMTP